MIKNLMILIISLLLLPLIIVYLAFSWGYAASVMYQWFIVPVFPDVPSLLWWQFAGIIYFTKCIIHPGVTKAYMKNEYSNNRMGNFIELMYPWALLGIGWVFKVMIL